MGTKISKRLPFKRRVNKSALDQLKTYFLNVQRTLLEFGEKRSAASVAEMALSNKQAEREQQKKSVDELKALFDKYKCDARTEANDEYCKQLEEPFARAKSQAEKFDGALEPLQKAKDLTDAEMKVAQDFFYAVRPFSTGIGKKPKPEHNTYYYVYFFDGEISYRMNDSTGFFVDSFLGLGDPTDILGINLTVLLTNGSVDALRRVVPTQVKERVLLGRDGKGGPRQLFYTKIQFLTNFAMFSTNFCIMTSKFA